ncbi:Arc family DNA-binding protein [Sulfitobacter sp. 1A09293]
MLRLPDGMRDRIKHVAEANNRSMNAEIVATLEEAYPAPSNIDELDIAAASAVMFHPQRAQGKFADAYSLVCEYVEENYSITNPAKVLDERWKNRSENDAISAEQVYEWLFGTLYPWADSLKQSLNENCSPAFEP